MLSVHLMLISLLFTNLIIGSQPVFCKYKGVWYSFLLSNKPLAGSQLLIDLGAEAGYDYHKLNYDWALWPAFNLDAKAIDPENAWLSPFSRNDRKGLCILGTYDLGRDVFAGCLYGLQKSLLLTLLTIFTSACLGICIGSALCFQTQRYPRLSLVSIFSILLFVFLLLYTLVLFIEWKGLELWIFAIFMILMLASLLASYFFADIKPQAAFRLDNFGLRYIEIMKSIPVLLILLILLQILKHPDTMELSVLMCVVYIPIVAKYSRAFTLSESQQAYVDSMIAIGQSGMKIYTKHVLPVVIARMIPVLAFGAANIVLLEASLSFLGLGLALDEVSLGTMMYYARSNPSAWWVILIPGLLVFWLVISLNLLGEHWANRKMIAEYQN